MYRRLLRKVHAVHAQLEPEKRTQIPLLQFQMALAMQVGAEQATKQRMQRAPWSDVGQAAKRVLAPAQPPCPYSDPQYPCPLPCPPSHIQGVELDIDEVECVAANLIFRKYVKGYISHKNKVMVVAKADPFPPLGSVALSD